MASINFYIYDNDFAFFKRVIQSNKNDYTHYVIIPHFLEGGENAYEVVNTISRDKLVMLDKLVPGVEGKYAAIYENFEKDIYDALEQSPERLSKYHTMKIVFPAYTYHPGEILSGFHRFCDQYAFNGQVVNDRCKEPVRQGEVFIVLMEDDLVVPIEKILTTGMKAGMDIGVISYIETPLKKIILDGVTTISTDFKLMGEKTAQMILENSKEHFEVPFSVNLRPSL